jgi:hypothetical protein
MLTCRIHAKENLRIEPQTQPVVGPGEVLIRLSAGGMHAATLRTGGWVGGSTQERRRGERD